jgi:hypothetical protein
MIDSFVFIPETTADQFILEMLKLGKPIELSLVGVFENEGRGSKRDIELPFHRDGDYSKDIAAKHSIDYVGLYCIKGGETETVIKVESTGQEHSIVLKEGQAVIMDNKAVLHARRGNVGDRLLMRVWIEAPMSKVII